MSKIVTAVNAMISNEAKISVAGAKDNELFFVYDGKHKWSLTWTKGEEGEYWLYFYPGGESIEELLSCPEWEDVVYVTYSTKELKTREAKDSFAELYGILEEKAYGVEEVLDDIIAGSET